MPSYQDYVVARDDHDPNTSTPGAAARGAAAASSGGKGRQSRVVRTRTFLIGNLDRGNMSKNGPAIGLEVRLS